MSSISSISSVNTENQQAVAVLLLLQKNVKSQGEAIQSLIEGARIDTPNENGSISVLA